MNMQADTDRLVEAYLGSLRKAAEPLPENRRTELFEEITAHIAEARAGGATSEAEVRAVLDQLGDPDEIVAAATDGLVLVDRYQPRFRGRDVIALALLPLGAFLAFVGWVLGVILLWTSDRWTAREKLLGTLVWPLGYVFVIVALTFPAPGGFTLPTWLGIPVAVLIAAAPLAVLFVLVRNAHPGRARQD